MLAKRSKLNDYDFQPNNIIVILNNIDKEEKMKILAEVKTCMREQGLLSNLAHFWNT